MERNQSTALVQGVGVAYYSNERVLVFWGRPCGNAWKLACILARELGARPVAVGL